MKLKLIAFDLDGTLVDAYPAIIKSLETTLKELQYPIPSVKKIKRAVGWGDVSFIETFVQPKDVKKALSIYRSEHKKDLVSHSSLLAGSLNILERLKKSGYKLAVASNRPTKFSRILIRALKIDKLFDYVLCGDKLENAKPYPEILNTIRKRLKLKKDEMIFVGDMTVDAQAGRRAGIKTVIVQGPSNTRTEISKEAPYRIIKDMHCLLKEVKEYDK